MKFISSYPVYAMRYTLHAEKKLLRSIWILTLLIVFDVTISFATKYPNLSTELKDGLRTTIFDTPNGSLIVYLPINLIAGDQISGTVRTTASGKNPQQSAKNKAILEGYVIEFADKKTLAGKGKEKWVIPTTLAGFASFLTLKDPGGKLIGKVEIPLSGKAPASLTSTPTTVRVTPFSKSGSITEIKGSFDGDFETSAVILDGKKADLLAESSDGVVFEIPETASGPSEILVIENGSVSRHKINILDISLSANKLQLLKGERANIALVVSGLEGVEQPVKVEIRNLTPHIIQLIDPHASIITIPPNDGSGNGQFPYIFEVRAVAAGNFSVGAWILPSFSTIESDDYVDDDIDYDDIEKAEDLPKLIRPGYDRYALSRALGNSHKKAMEDAFVSKKARERWGDIFKKIYGK